MTAEFDFRTLSAYVDGELDPGTMSEVEAYLDRDREARQFVINAVRTTVRLRAAGNKTLHEPLPYHLLKLVAASPPKSTALKDWRWPIFKFATAVAVLVVGIGLGFTLQRGAKSPKGPDYHPLPAAYQEAINASLETHLSGDPLYLKADGGKIIVTPVKTYRNSSGQYVRGYTLEFISGTAHRTLKGMAYRTGPSQWRTTAIFMPST